MAAPDAGSAVAFLSAEVVAYMGAIFSVTAPFAAVVAFSRTTKALA